MDIKSNGSALQSLIGGSSSAVQPDRQNQRDAALRDEARRNRSVNPSGSTNPSDSGDEIRGRLSSAEELAAARINAKRASGSFLAPAGNAGTAVSLSGAAPGESRFSREAPFGRLDTASLDANKPPFIKLGQIIDIYV